MVFIEKILELYKEEMKKEKKEETKKEGSSYLYWILDMVVLIIPRYSVQDTGYRYGFKKKS